MSKQKLKPAKKTKTAFNTNLFLYSTIISTATFLLLELIYALFFEGLGLGLESLYLIYIVPILLVFIAPTSHFLFAKHFKNFAQIEQALSKVSDGDFKTRIATERAGAFEQIFKNFNKMAEQLDNNKTVNDNFTHNFSHEFKTPIASIKGFADLLLEEELSPEEQKKYLSIISKESERLSHLAESALFISKISNDSIVSNKTVFDLGEQLKHCVVILYPQLSQKNIELIADIDSLKIYASNELLQEVWLNLLQNAIKFSNENSTIELSLKRNRDNAEITIKDYGIGMSEDEKTKIFQPYYQADTSHKSSGFGLGLSIVRRIVSLCDGEISVESAINKGSTFTISLPLGFMA